MLAGLRHHVVLYRLRGLFFWNLQDKLACERGVQELPQGSVRLDHHQLPLVPDARLHDVARGQSKHQQLRVPAWCLQSRSKPLQQRLCAVRLGQLFEHGALPGVSPLPRRHLRLHLPTGHQSPGPKLAEHLLRVPGPFYLSSKQRVNQLVHLQRRLLEQAEHVRRRLQLHPLWAWHVLRQQRLSVLQLQYRYLFGRPDGSFLQTVPRALFHSSRGLHFARGLRLWLRDSIGRIFVRFVPPGHLWCRRLRGVHDVQRQLIRHCERAVCLFLDVQRRHT